MNLSINITRRTRRRKLRNGTTVVQERYVLNYRNPRTGQRHQLFFERKMDAITRRDTLVGDYQQGSSVAPERNSITVADAVARWLENRKGEVCPRTHRGYVEASRYISGPVIKGTPKERYAYALAGRKPVSVSFLPVLGHYPVKDLSTGDIRAWHKMLWTEVGPYTANRAKMFLKTALALAAEDFNLRPAPMPVNLGRGRRKTKKAILAPEQVQAVLKAAQSDSEGGIYYVFPFLAGTRPSEQLGLLWREVDFEANVIRISRIQSDRGELIDMTKTEAGKREIPMCDLLRQLLIEWRVRCPWVAGELYRVFPGLGQRQAWPKPRTGGGGALLYQNFNKRFWVPGLEAAGVPHVTPHSARHTFISTLQMRGVEVGLVAKLAGHANPNVTLGHYTQAVRGGAEAVRELERALRPAS
jgi:integrase